MDLTPICGSPWLFAAYRVLLRLLTPRHSPYALSSLNFSIREFLICFLFEPPRSDYKTGQRPPLRQGFKIRTRLFLPAKFFCF